MQQPCALPCSVAILNLHVLQQSTTKHNPYLQIQNENIFIQSYTSPSLIMESVNITCSADYYLSGPVQSWVDSSEELLHVMTTVARLRLDAICYIADDISLLNSGWPTNGVVIGSAVTLQGIVRNGRKPVLDLGTIPRLLVLSSSSNNIILNDLTLMNLYTMLWNTTAVRDLPLAAGVASLHSIIFNRCAAYPKVHLEVADITTHGALTSQEHGLCAFG